MVAILDCPSLCESALSIAHFESLNHELRTDPRKAQDISPLVSIAALTLIGACTNEFDGILQGYLTDSYTSYAASANAPLAFLRGILSAMFPMFGEQMFKGLGSNVSGSILATIATAFCGIAVWFWNYGAKARERSKFAVSEIETADEWCLE